MMCLTTRWTVNDRPNMYTGTVGIEFLLLHTITYLIHALLHTAQLVIGVL